MFGVSPTRVTLKEGTMMDTAKIFLGLALVMFSAALMVTPSNAYGYDTIHEIGNGNATVTTGIRIATDYPLVSPSTGFSDTCADCAALAGEIPWNGYTFR